MQRIKLMETVQAYQVGKMSRRQFLQRATAMVGASGAAALLAACGTAAENASGPPPPVVDEAATAAEPIESSAAGNVELTTGTVEYPNVNADESLMGYLAYTDDGVARPAVIVLQEWWGLNDHIKDVANRFASAGFVALAPDLYRGVVTTEPDEARKQAMELGMRDAVGEIGSAVEYIKSQSYVTGKAGIVGFCMGGQLVFQSVAALDSLDAGIGFYGNPLRAAEAENVSVPVMTFLGTADRISASSVEAMHAVFESNGLDNHFQLYDGAQHSFFNDTRASYDPAAADDAWERSLAWFEAHLSG